MDLVSHQLLSSFRQHHGRMRDTNGIGSSNGSSNIGSSTTSISVGGDSDSPRRYHYQRNRGHQVPHRGALRRLEGGIDTSYVIQISVNDEDDDSHGEPHVLQYTRRDFEFAQRLFAILDTESRGLVDRNAVKEFVTLRCPVFWRRDDDLRRVRESSLLASPVSEDDSPTFDEIWASVISSSRTSTSKAPSLLIPTSDSTSCGELGVEGWIVFCRFIALAQYLEAKRRFSARHLQQTMRHRNAPRGSEVVVVDVPPPEPPAPLSPRQLADYEQKSQAPLPLPELDLDHSLLAAHDTVRQRRALSWNKGSAKVSLFSSGFSSGLLTAATTSSKNAGTCNLEFAVTYVRRSHALSHPMGGRSSAPALDEVVVRRSMLDMKWLDSTFASHKVLGGTLCGRILPPFPGTTSSSGSVLSSHFNKDDFMLNSSATGSAIEAAAAGVGRIRDAAKSLFGTYLTPSNARCVVDAVSGEVAVQGSPSATMSSSKKSMSSPSSSSSSKKLSSVNHLLALPESYYNPHSPAGKARHLERYLNYLLEHPALSTSFPLNTILKASQSGLEAAKHALEDCTRASKELKAQTPQLDDGKTLIPLSHMPNFAWVRTAAQAAMALRVHGMLETTGMPTASARLQHASLPSFGPSTRGSGWEDDEGNVQARNIRNRVHNEDVREMREDSNFEDGVVSVSSELRYQEESDTGGDDGYDLLPLPVPAPERTILSAGSDVNGTSDFVREGRFHYGTNKVNDQFQIEDDEQTTAAYLGDISVDDNIDKLREVIGSVDNTLTRCLSSSGGIGKARRERQNLHLDVVRGLDSWAGMRGQFVSQRSLLKGVAGLEQTNEIYEESGLALIEDISWQTSLASSAVAAAEDVRSAVRVARTASSAKAAANSAAFAAQNACDNGKFANIDEARAAQTRASIAQSHAIHAAVVDHEAKSVKRRATLALAHDVKCWNVHRKRETLRSCIAYARTQHEATRRAVDAWSSLRDGFIGTTVIPPAPQQQQQQPERRHVPIVAASLQQQNLQPHPQSRRQRPITDSDEMTTTIYDGAARATTGLEEQGDQQQQHEQQRQHRSIVAVDHNVLSTAANVEVNVMDPTVPDADTDTDGPEEQREDFYSDDGTAPASPATAASKSIEILDQPSSILPFATAAPIPEEEGEEDEDNDPFFSLQLFQQDEDEEEAEDNSGGLDLSGLLGQAAPGGVGGGNGEPGSSTRKAMAIAPSSSGSGAGGATPEEKLSASMQSLVDGLMSWGGGFEADEDHFALPAGMAASIALEGSSKIA